MHDHNVQLGIELIVSAPEKATDDEVRRIAADVVLKAIQESHGWIAIQTSNVVYSRDSKTGKEVKKPV